ncbi:hypothetical protein CHM34_01400 [Paludifilum halophilum]|uniref:Uncharacterized protein n=1 Tax=Paludifilum halophilum TaxID=1642702 RepID=A0A235BCK6_9BACL|nr:hypothetical protein CHM34_01400 [Paludifilum halophilum]
MILAHPWWVGVGFHTPFRCSDEPKALRVEPHPPENGCFHNASSPRFLIARGPIFVYSKHRSRRYPIGSCTISRILIV